MINYLPSRALCEKKIEIKSLAQCSECSLLPSNTVQRPMLGFLGLLWDKDVKGQRQPLLVHGPRDKQEMDGRGRSCGWGLL